MSEETLRKALAQAWDEGHETWWKRGPDDCECGAWSSGECGCGRYGSGELLSLAENPYRRAPDAVKLGCDVCGKPHTHISTPGGFRFCDEHRGKR